MARKIFVAATGQNIGKTTVCLSLLHLARTRYTRVGFVKPLGPKPISVKGTVVDKDAALMAQVFDLSFPLDNMSPVVVERQTTRDVIDGKLDPKEMEQRLVERVAAIEKECDFLLIEGSGHPGVGSVFGLSNARVAKLLDAPVMLVTGGGVGNVIDGVTVNAALFEMAGVPVRAVFVNKLIPEKRDINLDYLRRALTEKPFEVLGGFNYQPTLANPTLRRVAKVLDLPLHGNKSEGKRIIHHMQIGAPSTQRVVELLREDTLLIVTSSRDELLVTMANLYQFPEYHEKLVGLIIPGKQPIGPITQRILESSNIPYMRTDQSTTAEIYEKVSEDVSKISGDDKEKIDLIFKLAELRFEFDEIDRIFS